VGEDLDFFLLLGDQVYASAETVEEFRPYWERNLGSQGYLDLLSSQAVIATWDDHEVGNNWGDGSISEAQIEAGKQVFFEFTPCRPRLGDALYRSFRFGDTLELFVLDCRSERNHDEGQYISEDQLAWFLASVQESRAVFKLVLNSVTAMDLGELVGSLEAQDRWQGFPEQRARLIDGLVGVDNLYFLSGDFHTAIVGRLDKEGPGREIFDILVGPAGNTPNPMGDLLVPNEQFIGGLQGRNYTRFTADPDLETLLVEYIGEDGGLLGAFTLPPLESS
jgi:phosphodiesterase/alkaline phosphatase D-like protein